MYVIKENALRGVADKVFIINQDKEEKIYSDF